MIWIVIAVIAIVLIVIFYKSSQRPIPPLDDSSYEKLETLFSAAERSFLGVLYQAVEDNALVFGKVRVADVIIPLRGMAHKQWRIALNKTRCKHFDFILCDKNDLSILCAIELNDKSHETKLRKERDEFLIAACDSAGLPLIQVPAQSAYNVDEIRQSLIQHLSTDYV